jgi:hypothetical protein
VSRRSGSAAAGGGREAGPGARPQRAHDGRRGHRAHEGLFYPKAFAWRDVVSTHARRPRPGRSFLIPLLLNAHIAPATLIPGAGTEIHREEEIYEADGGWFNTCWHFCFDRYRDPEQVGVGPLRRTPTPRGTTRRPATPRATASGPPNWTRSTTSSSRRCGSCATAGGVRRPSSGCRGPRVPSGRGRPGLASGDRP